MLPHNGQRHEAHVYYVRLAHAETRTHAEAHEAGVHLVRYALARDFGLSADRCVFSTGPFGKPYLADHPEIFFNVSHSGDYVTAAVAAVPIGIDIELRREADVKKLGRRLFSPRDYRRFLASEDPRKTFFEQWVLRESYVKRTGEGLYHRDIRGMTFDGWFRFLHFDEAYVCAVSAEIPLDVHTEEIT